MGTRFVNTARFIRETIKVTKEKEGNDMRYYKVMVGLIGCICIVGGTAGIAYAKQAESEVFQAVDPINAVVAAIAAAAAGGVIIWLRHRRMPWKEQEANEAAAA